MNLGVLQAAAEKLNNEQLKEFKQKHALSGAAWEQVKNHVQSVRKLERMKNVS